MVGLIEASGGQVEGGGLVVLNAQASASRELVQAMYMMSDLDDIKTSHDRWFVRARHIKHTKAMHWRDAMHNDCY